MTNTHVVENLFALLDETGKQINLGPDGQLPKESAADLIPLKKWAASHGISAATARQKALRGGFATARKIGRDWFISASEANPDHRSDRMNMEAKLPQLTGSSRPLLEGPVWFGQVMNCLLALNSNALPDFWATENAHQEYCKKVFFELKSQLRGNARILFNLLCDALEKQEDAVYYIPHTEILDNLYDEKWQTSNEESTINSGITVDFDDYLVLLGNTAEELLSHQIRLKVHHGHQTLIMPWYHSLTWRDNKDDGLYFVPSDFFKTIFTGM